MDTQIERRRLDGSIAVGIGLVIVGMVGYGMTSAGMDVGDWLGGSGWTMFLIVPGLALLVVGLVTSQPVGLGLTIAGVVVTTLGLMMLVMDQTDTWETWAFAWALVPTAAGVGLVLHGLRSGSRNRIRAGGRLAAIGAVLFGVGAWYFGTLFQTGTAPLELGNAWPLVIVGIGIVVVIGGLLSRSPRKAASPA